MKSYLIILTALFLVHCSPNTIDKEQPLLAYLSNQDDFVIRTDHLNQLKANLSNNSQFLNFINHGAFKNAQHRIELLQKIDVNTKALISIREIGKEDIDFLIITELNQSTLAQSDQISSKTYQEVLIEKRVYPSKEKEQVLYSVILEETLLISSSQLLIENTIRNNSQQIVPESLNELFKVTEDNSLYFKLDAGSFLLKNNFYPSYTNSFGKWGALRIDLANKKMAFHGFNSRNDSLPYFLNLFRAGKPVVLKSPHYIPEVASNIKMYAIEDVEQFNSTQNKIKNKDLVLDTIFNTVEEIATFKLKENTLALIHFTTLEPTYLSKLAENNTPETEYRDYPIYRLNNALLVETSFSSLWDKLGTNYVVPIAQSLLFSKDITDLKTVIGNLNTGTTLENSPAFTSTKASLAEASTVLFYEAQTNSFNPKKAGDYFLAPNKKEDKNTKVFASQWVGDQDFFHQHLVFLDLQPKKDQGGVSPLLSLQLENPISYAPQWVKNHINKKQEILVQDNQNQLYLFDNSGKLLWKKQLQGAIQGKVSQVDLYKNGRLQLAFTTTNQWLILDRNGNEVPPFNKTFKDGNLSPLAVFDYDNNKEYRFVFGQGKDIYMYDRNVKSVNGFKYKKTKSSLLEAPKHFKIKGDDYLVFKGIDGSLDILNRIGKTRVKTAVNYSFSDNEIALLDQQFSFTDLQGNLFQINTKGKESKKPLKVNAAHRTAMNFNQLVVLEDNVLYSKGKKVVLDFGIYTPPTTIKINQQIYISITDTQNKKVYLFDNELKMLGGFPVYGSGEIDLVESSENGALKFVTKDKENSLVVYRVKESKITN
tara:strand:+ start:535 stop:2994 length:2460 start_codon:yes stop_codon:yes gene_type:complete